MPAPSNDNFASATSISTSLPQTITSQTTVDSTYESGEPLIYPASNESRSVWYTFTPAHTGTYRFRIYNFGADVSTVVRAVQMGIYTGSAVNSLTLVERNYNNSSATELVIRKQLTSGVTYRITVGAPWYTSEDTNSHVFNYDLSVTEITSPGTPPANDDIANAEDLGTDPSGTFSGSNIDATYEGWEGSGGYTQPSVWYKFTIDFTGTQTVSLTKTGTDPDWQPYAEIYTVTSAPPASFSDLSYFNYLGDNIQNATVASTDVAWVPGDYYLVVYNWNFDGSWDDFDLEFQAFSPPPANDNFANRVVLPKSYTVSTTGTTDGASTEFSEPNVNPGSLSPMPSVWYEWTSQNDGNQPMNYQIDTLGSSAETYLEIFTGSSLGSLTSVASDHNSGAGGKSQLTLSTNGSITYKIRVSSPLANEGTFNLHITGQPGGSPPANDNFANAILMTGYSDSESGTTVGATAEVGEPIWGVGDQTTNTVWYKWVPPQTGRVRVEFSTASASMHVNMARGTALNNLQEIQYFTVGAAGNTNYDYVTVEGGVDYYFIVQGYGGAQGTFTVSFYMENVSIPANNNPATPTVLSFTSGTSTITDNTKGSYFDTVGPDTGDFVTEAQELSTLWYKLTATRHGRLTIHVNNDVVYNNDSTWDALIKIYKGSTVASLTSPISVSTREGAADAIADLEAGQTYWISVESFYWSTTLSWDYNLNLQSTDTGGHNPNVINGLGDFDSTTGTFNADEVDGVFVASGGVGYGTLTLAGGHGPSGWWTRFEVESSTGQYLYRYGQTQQFIEIFRATREDDTYESICVLGHKEGNQTIAYYQNGTLRYDTGHAVWGANKYGSSTKVRIEVGRNGVTIDGVNFFVPTTEGFVDTPTNKFVQFDYGIITYPGDGTSYVDLDPEWDIRISDLSLHDNPEISVMGPADPLNKEVTSFYGWTTGDIVRHTSSDYQFAIMDSHNPPTVAASAGEYSDGYSLVAHVTGTTGDATYPCGGAFSVTQPTDSIRYDPYGDPAYDTFFPGVSFRFYVHDNFPSEPVTIAQHLGTDSKGTQGWNLILGDDGTLYIRPSQNSDMIPFCYVNVNEWTYIEIQWDAHIRPYACKIWMQGEIYIGRFEEDATFNATTMARAPVYLTDFGLGRLGDAFRISGNFNDIPLYIEFRDVATTRAKAHRPLGPTIVVGKTLNGVGTHNYPTITEGELPSQSTIINNGDFTGSTDGAGQPAYWTSYDRFDSPIPPGAMILDYLGQTLADSICSIVTDGSGPTGLESLPALRIEAVANDEGYETGNAVGYVVGNGADVTYNIEYADTISMQFWIKGKAGWEVSCYANSGIGTLNAYDTFTIEADDVWQYIRTFVTPQTLYTGGLGVTSFILQIDGMSVGDYAYVKDVHVYANPDNNNWYRFYKTTDNGSTVTEISPGDTTSYQLIDEFPPTVNGDHIYANVQIFQDTLRGVEADGKTHLPPKIYDYYLEYKFGEYNPPDGEKLLGAKLLLQAKDYSSQNYTGYGGSGPVYIVTANTDGDYRAIGGRRPRTHSDDPNERRFGITLRRPPGLGEWTINKWNAFRMRFGFHHKLFISTGAIIADFSNAGVLEGAYAELLTYDRRLPNPHCVKPVDLSRVRFRAFETNDVDA